MPRDLRPIVLAKRYRLLSQGGDAPAAEPDESEQSIEPDPPR